MPSNVGDQSVTYRDARSTLEAVIRQELRSGKRTNQLPRPIREAADKVGLNKRNVGWEYWVTLNAMSEIGHELWHVIGGSSNVAGIKLNDQTVGEAQKYDADLGMLAAKTLEVMQSGETARTKGKRISVTQLPRTNTVGQRAAATQTKWLADEKNTAGAQVVAGQYGLNGDVLTEADLGQLAKKIFDKHFAKEFSQAILNDAGGALQASSAEERVVEEILFPDLGRASYGRSARALVKSLGSPTDISYGHASFSVQVPGDKFGSWTNVTLFANRELGRFVAFLNGPER